MKLSYSHGASLFLVRVKGTVYALAGDGRVTLACVAPHLELRILASLDGVTTFDAASHTAGRAAGESDGATGPAYR
jgi:hypothetical protein